MLAQVQKYIEAHNLIKPGELVIVAVSGGPDSMALLHILHSLSPAMGFGLAAAHLNHGLRPEADAEESFVRDYCTRCGIANYSRQVDVGQAARREKKSLEEAGRESRYQFFAELADSLGAARIATAHHQDDNAETVLLNLVRGSGVKGLRGIRPVNGMVIRPLLVVGKNQIEQYLKENCIGYCIDQSNYSSDYLRNRIRHKLLPLLQQEYNPRIITSLTQLAVIAAGENEAIEMETERQWEALVIEASPEEIALDSALILQLHPAYQRRLILKALCSLGGETGWSLNDVEQVRKLLLKTGSNKSLQLKKGLRVKKVYRELVFSLQPVRRISFNYKVKVPGEVFIRETGQCFRFLLLGREEFKPEAGDFYLDFDKIEGELYLRSRRPGDVFAPSNMQGHKKLKDFFIDLKIPQEERDEIALLTTAAAIYAVSGYRISRHALVDSGSRRILLIKSINGDKNKREGRYD